MRFEGSDHRPIISFFEPALQKRKGLFRYDRRMRNNMEIKKLVADAWNTNHDDMVEQRISNCRKEISKWNRKHHLNNRKAIEELKEKLDKAMSSSTIEEELVQMIQEELKKSYMAEEEYWKQRSRQLWLTLGDKNTGYFHAVSKSRKQ